MSSIPSPRILAAALLVSAACGGGNDPGKQASAVAIAAGNNQSAPVGSAVPVPPAVLVTDDNGDPLQGVRVTFTAVGQGSVTGGTATSKANGIATVGSWTLGTSVGTNTLNASVPGAGSIAFTAQGTPGSPVRVAASTPTSVVGVIGAPVSPPPAVRVEDAFGNGVPGVTVTFAVTSGGGSVTGAIQVTNSAGVATVGSWTLGSGAGTNTLTATTQPAGLTGNPVTFTATGASSAYAIDLRYLSGMSPSHLQAFQNAQARLQNIIIGDVSNQPVNITAGRCLPNQPAVNETVDDIIIFAEVAAIDGPGKILGQAGPCIIRGSNGLPVVGIMQFDVDDLTSLEQSGLLPLVILHEMLHVVGVGSVWGLKGLLSGAGGSDPFFVGPRAIASFNSVGGDAYVGNRVPVEGTGGPGTRDSHWRETVFKAELMTGFINNGVNPLSVVTISSLADLGYTVDTARADPFVVVPPFVAPPAAARAPGFMLEDRWNGPLYRVDPRGQTAPVPRP